MRIAILLAVIVLAGCTQIQPPLVDMNGKELAQFNYDFNDCKHQLGFIDISTNIDRCLEGKGYTMLK